MSHSRSWYGCLLAFGMLASVSSAQDDAVLVINSSGAPTEALIPNLNTPRGTALDQANGLFFVSEAGAGQVLRVDLTTGVTETFVTGVQPFDLEIDPVSGDLFISDALSGSILRTPTDTASTSTFTDAFVPSGLGFAPNGSLFAGAQPSSPSGAGLFEVTFNSDGTGAASQVGNLIQPFDVQVDSQGNVFVNNSVDFPVDGELAVFPGLGAGDNSGLAAPLPSQTFSDVTIRGLAIGPNDEVFASTGDLTIVEFEPLVDLNAIDPATNVGSVFAGPPVSDIGDPFAFDIQFLPGGDFQVLLSADSVPGNLVPEPTSLALFGLASVVLVGRRRA